VTPPKAASSRKLRSSYPGSRNDGVLDEEKIRGSTLQQGGHY
jgi:hypothetical protein